MAAVTFIFKYFLLLSNLSQIRLVDSNPRHSFNLTFKTSCFYILLYYCMDFVQTFCLKFGFGVWPLPFGQIPYFYFFDDDLPYPGTFLYTTPKLTSICSYIFSMEVTICFALYNYFYSTLPSISQAPVLSTNDIRSAGDLLCSEWFSPIWMSRNFIHFQFSIHLTTNPSANLYL